MTDPTKEDIAYPRDLFSALIHGNSPYAFYLFQWVPYQTEAKRWRLKLQHDVRTFDGREAFNVWPNGNHCGPFTDDEVEFIRISRSQFGEGWQDPRNSAQAQAVEPLAEADTVQLVGVKDGVETVIGTATMPPKMKARELVRGMFGPFDEEAGDDGAMAYAVCEELIDWMAKTPHVINVTAPSA